MIERMERLSRSGDKDAAKQLLEQLQQMLENLQMAQPGQGQGENGDMQQSLNELGDMIRKQQQLRDKTYKQGQEFATRPHARQRQGDHNPMNGLQQDQQALRDGEAAGETAAGTCQARQMGPRGQHGQQGQERGSRTAKMASVEADSAMGDADGRLGEGNADERGRCARPGAGRPAQRAPRSLAEAMQQGARAKGRLKTVRAVRPARRESGGNQTDPLGRPLHGRELGNDLTVKIPGEIDVQRVRRFWKNCAAASPIRHVRRSNSTTSSGCSKITRVRNSLIRARR